MTLADWSIHYHSTEEMRQVFYAQSNALKRTHHYGYYVTDFNLDQILIGNDEHNKNYIIFKSVSLFPENQEAIYMKKNVKTECFQEIGLYCSMLSDVTIEFTPTFLQENMDRFSPFLPEKDFQYYKRVFVYDTMMYLCDYIDKQNEGEIAKLEGEVGATHTGKFYTKSTPQGKMLKDQNDIQPFQIQENASQAAFAHTFLLPFVIFTLSLLIPLLAMIFGSIR